MESADAFLEDVARWLLRPVADVIQSLGGAWSEVAVADESDGGWRYYAAGEPTQVIVGLTRQGDVLVAQPDPRWEGQQPVLGLGRVHLTGHLDGLALGDLVDVVEAALKGERRKFQWCRHCRRLVGPGERAGPGLCMSCASEFEGIVF